MLHRFLEAEQFANSPTIEKYRTIIRVTFQRKASFLRNKDSFSFLNMLN